MFFKQISEGVYSATLNLLDQCFFCCFLFFSFFVFLVLSPSLSFFFFFSILLLYFSTFFSYFPPSSSFLFCSVFVLTVLLCFCLFQGYLSGSKTNIALLSSKGDFGWSNNNTFVVSSKGPSVHCWKKYTQSKHISKVQWKAQSKAPQSAFLKAIKDFGLLQPTQL